MYLAKDNICVIYDDDESYAKRLMGIINDSKDIPYRAKVFTKEEEFNRYILYLLSVRNVHTNNI